MKQAVRQNFEEKVSYAAQVIPGMRVTDAGGVLTVDCGLPSDTFNVIVVRDASPPEQPLAQSVEHFMAKRFPAALWYWQEDAARFSQHPALAARFVHAETHVAMVAERQQVPRCTALPDGLTISAVAQPGEMRQYGQIVARLFGDSDEGRQVTAYFDLLSADPACDFPAARCFIGTYHGQAVATGSLFLGRETLGIYDIVTAAEYRGRGIGSAMFAHLLREASAYGQRWIVLQASAAGIGIYLKAGFQPVGQVHTFENRPLLPAPPLDTTTP